MKIEELQNMVGLVKANETKKEEIRLNKEERKNQGIKATLEREWNGKICEWLENLNFLASNGYVLLSSLKGAYAKCPSEQIGLCTDGVYHNFGLIDNSGFWKYSTHFLYMGIEMGGACGNRNIYTNGKEWFVVNSESSNGCHLEMETKEYERIARDGYKCLVDFESKYNTLLNSIRIKSRIN